MKNMILFSLIFLSAITSMPINAQASTSQWRLVKKTWLIPGDALDIYEYQYDGNGRITEVRNLSGKTLKSTEKDFVYNDGNRISSFNLYIKGSKLYTYTFTYDDKGRLTSRQEIYHEVNFVAKDKITLTRTFRYEGNKIIENSIRPSFGGKLVDEITYPLDGNGNLLRHDRVHENKSLQPEAGYVYGAYSYQGKPAVAAYTGAYFFTDLNSPDLGDEGHLSGDTPAGTQYTFNSEGLVSKEIVTYIASDGRKYPHTYNYTYVKLKP